MSAKDKQQKALHESGMKAMKAAQELRKCQAQFCKKQLAASEALAASIKTKTSDMLKRLGSKQITHDQFLKELQHVREELLTNAATKDLGSCMIDKCQGKLRESFMEALNVFKALCKSSQKPSCSIYKQGIALLRQKNMDVDAYISFLRVIAQRPS